MMPKISVIITTHNRVAMLQEALTGVLGQTYTDWECWVMDDGSSDDTPSVAQAYCARDARVHYVRHEANETQRDKKVIAARNRGIALANGDFIAFLDDDDVWLPQYLEKTMALLLRRPDAVLATAARIYWDGQESLTEQWFRPDIIAQPLRAMIRHCYLVPSHCVIRREFLNRTELFRQPGAEDMDLWLQLLPLGPPVFVMESLVKYRVHAGSSQADQDGSRQRTMTKRQIETLRRLLRRKDISFYDRLLAIGNIQRKQEQILALDIELGSVPRSRFTRLLRLLAIFPPPLLRSPTLSKAYLSYNLHNNSDARD